MSLVVARLQPDHVEHIMAALPPWFDNPELPPERGGGRDPHELRPLALLVPPPGKLMAPKSATDEQPGNEDNEEPNEQQQRLCEDGHGVPIVAPRRCKE